MLKKKFAWEGNPLFLVDGSSYIYRAFYAYRNLTRSDGFPTNVIYIVLRLILKILKEEKPRYLGFFVDGPKPTFRKEIWAEYKANRLKMPEDLAKQIPSLLQGLKLLGVYSLITEGIEADDCIASLAARFKDEFPIVIVGSDKDLNQLLSPGVFIWDPGGKEEKFLSVEDFVQKWHFAPRSWPDFQALVGDSSDNIPGVPGIGPKTAQNILKQFATLEELEQNLDKLKGKARKVIEECFPKVYQYRELTRLRQDCCQEIDLKTLTLGEPDWPAFKNFCKEYEFFSLLREIEELDSSKKRVEKGKAPNLPFFELEKKASTKVSRPQVQEKQLKNLEQICAIWKEGEKFFIGDGKLELEINEKLSGEFLDTRKEIYLSSLKDFYSQYSFPWIRENCFDLSLAAYLLDPEQRDYSLSTLLQGIAREVEHLVSPGEPLSRSILSLGKHLRAKLQAANLEELLLKLEQPLSVVLVNMEKRGILLDLEKFKLFLKEVKKELKDLTQEIYKLAGKEFNIRSSQQLAQVLFEELKLKSRKKTPTGQFSTAESALESLRHQHPIVELILRYRSLEKLRSTYLEPLPKKVDSKNRLHTTFNQLATATGRLSSSNPNLQNIPIKGEYGPRMRACFVAPENKFLLSADYSQIELRILAHFSQDPYLVQAFKEGQDIHTATACLILEKKPQEISADDRRKAKTINFGLLYGMGPLKLSRELNISLKEAKSFIELYFKKFAGVKRFYEQVETQAMEKGFVTTILGRRRFLPHIFSRNEQMVAQAKRMAINTVVQGSAADVIKKAMLLVEEDEVLKEIEARQILQVHDELVLEVPRPKIELAVQRIKEIMEGVYAFAVPLVVDVGFGHNWGEAHS